MALVNYNYEFIFVDVGKNGRLSDGGVIEYTEFFKRMNSGELNLPENLENIKNLNFVFIGDEAFALTDNILKPYSQKDLDHDKRIFNYRLSRARNVVENTFGIISSRFRVLHTAINMKVGHVCYVVLAICALHNFLRRRGNGYITNTTNSREDVVNCTFHEGDWQKDAVELPSLQRIVPRNQCITAKNNRDAYKAYFVAEGCVPWQEQMLRAGRA